MKRRFYGVSFAVLALVLTGCVDRDGQEQAEQIKEIVTDTSVPVRLVSAMQSDVAVELELTGSLATDDDVSISAKLPGRLTAVYVREGDSVTAGQVIATQETADATAQLRQAQAQVAAARSQLSQAQTQARISPDQTSAAVKASEARVRQAKAALQKLLNGARNEEKRQAKAALDRAQSDLETAEKARDRAKRLLDQGAIAQQDFEAAENRYRSALAGYTSALEAYNLVLDSVRPEDIESAREQVRQAEAQLEADRASKRLDPVLQQQVDAARANLNAAMEQEKLARFALSDLTIRAPQSGKISGTPLKAGSYVAPGTPIARLIGVTGLFYEAEVPEKDITRLEIGMPVQVTVQAANGVQLTGQVSSIAPLASDLGRLYQVRVSLIEDLAQLKPGMFARGTVTLSVEDGVTTVPNGAIVRDGENSYVFVVNGTTAERREITIRMTDNGSTVVEGVSPGEQVVLDGKTNLIDGATVVIENGESEPAPEEGNEQEG